MFLVNSRTPLVSATCGSGTDPDRRHPFYRRYGASLPNSLGRSYPSRLGLLSQGHVSPFSVRSSGIAPDPLFTGPRDQPKRDNPAPSWFGPLLALTALQGPIPLGTGDDPCRPTPRRRRPGLRCRTYPGGRGILTPFPFAGEVLPPGLGPTHPRLTISAEEPWPFRRRGLSPLFAATSAGILIPDGSIGGYPPTSRPSGRPPTGSEPPAPPPGLGGRLEPRPSSAPPSSAGELLRTP